ncbi:cytochrome o ubiquinol oxidase operon protein cyoD [Variovorax paradoxus]|uniref:cytochrome o ubiquinol oxidase subunit IV n=1 Tax=Variovorax paradoxus TaxID=34073 RepID=UPI00279048BC|nr:cytochrome o ubiquinol oxidase subunit IV [Variovorax paradoxus]MDQ0568760.1 cytochrome o ubiquinol oxidase operon protein cyoD [Variovorax paradoxus]
MSTAHTETAAHGHGAHDAHDDHHDDGPVSHSTFKGYMTGFVLAVILTAIPFWLVMGKVLVSTHTTSLVILGFAAVQIVVHMIYFLHMDAKSESGWNMLALIFTIVLVVITLAGSLWVMYHMNANMMPMSVHDMKNMP